MARLRAGPERPFMSEMSPASRARQPQHSGVGYPGITSCVVVPGFDYADFGLGAGD
jgi:predicted cupin superfamily sugar epimerase